MFLISVVSSTLSSFTDKDIDVKQACVSREYAQKSIGEIENNLTFPIETVLSLLANQLGNDDINEIINDRAKFDSVCININSLVAGVKLAGDQGRFEEFSNMIWNG